MAGRTLGDVTGRGGSAGPETLFAVDVGNTSTHVGLFRAGELTGSYELTTPGRLTADEALTQARAALAAITGERGGVAEDAGEIAPDSAILSCVVPPLADAWTRALSALTGSRALVVGPGLKTGLKMSYDDPAEVGADRVADAVAAQASYGAPVVVVDLGTTTNLEVIDEHGAFAGGVIAPGIALGADSLARAAARLPMIELRAPARVIGRNTRAAMQSGVVLGEAARIDGLIDAIFGELGREAPVVLTGNEAAGLAPLLSHEVTVDASLTLRGLELIWRRNRARR